MTEGFVAKREDVCAGLLLKDDAEVCRRMIYKVENEASTDLRYLALSYQIGGHRSTIDVPENFQIYHHVNLGPVLPYIDRIGSKVYLTQSDIDYIFCLLLKNRRWLEQNKELFGYHGKIELVPNIIYSELRMILTASEQWWVNVKEPNYEYAKKRKH